MKHSSFLKEVQPPASIACPYVLDDRFNAFKVQAAPWPPTSARRRSAVPFESHLARLEEVNDRFRRLLPTRPEDGKFYLFLARTEPAGAVRFETLSIVWQFVTRRPQCR